MENQKRLQVHAPYAKPSTLPEARESVNDWGVIGFFKAIFNWAPKVIRDCIGFAIAVFSVIGPENPRHSLRSTNQVQNERKHDFGARVFPRFRWSVCFYF